MDGWRVFLTALLPVALAFACDRWRGRLRLRETARQLSEGGLFGLAGVAMLLLVLGGPFAGLPFCDACMTVAAFWFGARAGLGALAVVVVARTVAMAFGLSAGVSDVIGSAAVGVFAIALSKYLFRDRRPAVVPATLLAALAEVLHLAVCFLLDVRDASSTMDFILGFVALVPAFCSLAAFGAAVVCGSWGGWRPNFLSAATGVAAFYVLALAGTLKVGLDSAEHKTEALLEYAEDDLRTTIDESLDVMLSHVGRSIVARLGELRPKTVGEMQAIAAAYDLDEANLVSREGRVVGSNRKTLLDLDLSDHPETTGRFMVLTNGETEVYSQPFRASVGNPDSVCKFLGVAFPGGAGFLQLGYAEKRLARCFAQSFGGMLEDWHNGETGYYVCADMSGRVVAPTDLHPGIVGKSLADIGIDLSQVPEADSGVTFVQTVFGEPCFCRLSVYARHLMFSVVPAADYYGPALRHVFAAAAILFVVFAVFGYVIGRMVDLNRRIVELRENENVRRERDLQTAKTIQTSVMPAVFPPFPGETRFDLFASMDPAREVGGDFYDFYRLDADHLALVIADVSGKGVPAAMFMMRARVLLKTLCTAGVGLAKAVTAANRRLSDGNAAGMFVTAWATVVDLRTGEAAYVNAGHNPPYVRRADGRLERLDFLSGPMLAVFGEAEYRSRALKLDPGDMLVLYTDGVTEATDGGEELYGEPRLEETIAASRGTDARGTCAAILDAVGAFAAGTPQSDDITLLAFGYGSAKS